MWDHFADFLSKTDPEDPRYFGRQFNATRGEYYAGGSGIVLSRGVSATCGPYYTVLCYPRASSLQTTPEQPVPARTATISNQANSL